MYEKFTDRARLAIHLAFQEALRLNHAELKPEHILIGLIKERKGFAAWLLRERGFGGDPDLLRAIRATMTAGNNSGKVELLARSPASTIIESASGYCDRLQQDMIGTGTLLFSLLVWVDFGKFLPGLTCAVIEHELLAMPPAARDEITDMAVYRCGIEGPKVVLPDRTHDADEKSKWSIEWPTHTLTLDTLSMDELQKLRDLAEKTMARASAPIFDDRGYYIGVGKVILDAMTGEPEATGDAQWQDRAAACITRLKDELRVERERKRGREFL